MTLLAHEKEINEYEKALAQLKKQSGVWPEEEIKTLEDKLEQLKSKIYSELTPWDRIAICRHPKRPHTTDYIEALSEEFEEIFGDRSFSDDPSIIMGFAKIEGESFFIIGQEKGKDTESRIHRNFGMPHPEGYRKALRGMKLAEKFQIPIVTFIDTPGAYPGLAAEERGQGWAIAKNIQEMAGLQVPVIVMIIGEGCSGGALGIGIGDKIAMLEHSYYSVISPEGCASILFKDTNKNAEAASMLKLHAEELYEFQIIDHIIKEPVGGAHYDPKTTFERAKSFLLKVSKELKSYSTDSLLDRRYQKFRKLGALIKMPLNETFT